MKKLLLSLLVFLCAAQINAQTLQGNRYRGWVEEISLAGNDGVFKDVNSYGAAFSTTHGYQINKNLFIGVGAGIVYNNLTKIANVLSFPSFANFRVNMNAQRVSPFFDAKIGYSFGDLKGIYAAPSFGVRVGLHKNLGLNFSFGYTAQGYEYIDYSTNNKINHSATFAVGFDF